MSPLLIAQHLSHQFGSNKVLQNISFNLHAGEIITLIGPNGAGKSTLLKILLGLIEPSHGKVQLAKECKIGYMPQKSHISPALPMHLARFLQTGLQPPAHPKLKLAQIVDELRLTHLMEQPIQALSGGEMQRALLARALQNNPHLLVLDEPTQGVDLQGQTELYHYLNDIRHRIHCGILMVSHDLHIVMKNTDQVLCLNQHLCCSGHPHDVSQNPEFIKLFGEQVNEIALYEHHHTQDCNHIH